MIYGGRRAALLLFLGDLGIFTVSLWITLLIRYRSFPTQDIFVNHLGPFSLLFVLWTFVFYVSGLYGKRVLLAASSLPDAIVKTQFFNIVFAALFFFFVPGIAIAPKTNLLIYLGVSLLLIFLWRLAFYPRLSLPRFRDKALLLAEGDEADRLVQIVNSNRRYHYLFAHIVRPSELTEGVLDDLGTHIEKKGIHLVVTDTEDARTEAFLPALYRFTCYAEKPQFLSFSDVYEDVFDRIPLSRLRPAWFVDSVSVRTPLAYMLVKRLIDLVGGLLMGLVTLIATPFIWILNGFEGPGPLFITQRRIGKDGCTIRTYKFRSMKESDAGAWSGETKNEVTKVGAVLRKTSLDEFPQFINVLKGEISLIGPRNDISALGERLAEALPNYNFRYMVTPGITGWAQINQQYEQGNISPQSIEETKTRLAYDFYYLKHRSLGLDFVIALKTMKRMFFRVSTW